ncbi:hypothetical protein [Anaerolentibacter hominis]|uniref:hypothetical protein n=1 Tax=Anaerolentibacter hominis TaxID=3079009 RepID=UPI0031B862A3
MGKRKEIKLKWRRLDNTANIYPVVSSRKLSNVYRVSIVLKEPVVRELLQQALETIIPWFDLFNVRLRRGVFWYYFETNKKTPLVEEEVVYPCRFMDPYGNGQYLFRVSFYDRRINLEVFHALTDGAGAMNFLKELAYQYIRLAHPQAFSGTPDGPTRECIFDMEDSYLKYYKKTGAKGYRREKAYQLKGNMLASPCIGILHGYMDVGQVKEAGRKYQASITQYFTAVIIWSIYTECLNMQKSRRPIVINIPVNLRQFFPSTTTMNFFGIVLVRFDMKKNGYTFQEILDVVADAMKEQLNIPHMEDLISYNVSNEKNGLIRRIPLFIKNMGIKWIYSRSSKSFTTTVSNVGIVKTLPEYEPYIDRCHVTMGVSKKQPFKCGVVSYQGRIAFTISSVLADTRVQRSFFRKLAEDGIHVELESNGVYDETL